VERGLDMVVALRVVVVSSVPSRTAMVVRWLGMVKQLSPSGGYERDTAETGRRRSVGG
jgi:hypothetical protein